MRPELVKSVWVVAPLKWRVFCAMRLSEVSNAIAVRIFMSVVAQVEILCIVEVGPFADAF